MKRLAVSSLIALAASPVLAQPSNGKTVYAGYCQACHQASGQGMKPTFPALAADPFVVGPPGPVIDTVLKGRSSMPPFKGQLDEVQIAAAITYIRAAFGNHAGPVTAAQVAAHEKAR